MNEIIESRFLDLATENSRSFPETLCRPAFENLEQPSGIDRPRTPVLCYGNTSIFRCVIETNFDPDERAASILDHSESRIWISWELLQLPTAM